MAVIEIAKIQVRRGQENQTGVPQLDGGEFAWAADTERLYIGLRREDGGSRDTNVEILTENHLNNLFAYTIAEHPYIYKYGNTSTVVNSSGITAEDGTNDEFSRTVQDRLDDWASIKNFGVYGNGVDWDLRKFQFAIDRVFLNTAGYNPHPRTVLHAPAGTYVLTGTVYLPANTTIVGDGPGRTVFVLTTNSGALFKTMAIDSTNGENPLDFDGGSGEGSNFTTSTAAVNIHLEGLTLTVDPTMTTITEALILLSLDCSDRSLIKNVEFVGFHVDGSTETSSSYIGLNLRGKTADGTNENSIIQGCTFKNLYHGITSNYDIRGTLIEDNKFYELVRGINFNDPISPTTALIGPNNIKIKNNYFDLVEQQAIYVGVNNVSTGSRIISQNNTFDRVGYNGNVEGDYSSSATAVISFLTDENSSIDDVFRRTREQNFKLNVEESTTTYYPKLIEGHAVLDNNFVSTATIEPGTTGTTFLRIPITGNSQHLDIKYSAFRENAGIFVTSATNDVSASFTFTVADITGVTIGAITSGTDIPVGAVVTDISLITSEVTLDQEIITLTSGTEVTFEFSLDRMGNLAVYLQDSDNPDTIVVDNYNFISGSFVGFDGGLTFDARVNSTYTHYEIYATLSPTISVPVSIEYQTKLMI